MKKIILTKNKTSIVDDIDFIKVSKYKWCFDGYYARCKINGKNIRMHRFILDNPNSHIDHIDGDKLNNCRSNLRLVTIQQNQMNRTKSAGCSSRFKGVCFVKTKNKFKAYIDMNRIRINIGHFIDENKAAEAYNIEAKKYFGEFAKLNIL